MLFERPPTRPSPSSGHRPPTPSIFNQYEVGRAGETPEGKGSHMFRSETKQQVGITASGEPGAYDPYLFDDYNRMYGYSKVRRAFDSTDVRKLNIQIGELGLAGPSPGHYPHEISANYSMGKAYAAVDSQRSVFSSRSLQRPSSSSYTPDELGPGYYNYMQALRATMKNKNDGGAGLRSRTPRKINEEPSTTPRHVGPGCYDKEYGHEHRTLASDAVRVSNVNKRQPGFGSTSAARALPFHAREQLRRPTPAPGEHHPVQGGMSPRTPRTPRSPHSTGVNTPRSALSHTPRSTGGLSAANTPRAANGANTPRAGSAGGRTPRSARGGTPPFGSPFGSPRFISPRTPRGGLSSARASGSHESGGGGTTLRWQPSRSAWEDEEEMEKEVNQIV